LLKKVRNTDYKIIGYDKAPSAVIKAKDNIENANLDSFITVEQRNFFETEKEVEGPTTLLFNPPYGERLQIETAPFYKEIGDTLKNHYPDTTVWFITSDFEGLKHVGLRTSKKIPLKNGDLDCKFVRYDMYAGTKKISNS
jgi:putative N6-adenine-specific DNA methylase